MELGCGGGFGPEAAPVGDSTGCPGDDLFVDELLDFSNGFSETEEPPPPPGNEPGNGEAALEKQETPAPQNRGFVAGDGFGSLHESELSVQWESLESLEWLSHFVEDSLPDYSLAGKFHTQPADPPAASECLTTQVQTKARTKRARTGVRVWPVLSPSSAEPDASSSSSAFSTTSFPPPSKRKTKPGGGAAAGQRRCVHCGVTKTPQWRAGPLGPKTLCNACGVRYKSGRLLPEYRPACSPSFSSEQHSNNHRKCWRCGGRRRWRRRGRACRRRFRVFEGLD
ncbi:GATA transcription factor 5 [Striga hermonthica]|uniref:GATA transcription factor n=1 Tax=Striga hermonthica TaxID=68872 RepID=A0A9N7RS42_STRHE|nr:GATA transcription factor 5 [Striga hermonthica]